MTKVKSVCLVCHGKGEVIDKNTKKLRPCVACKGTGIIWVEHLPIHPHLDPKPNSEHIPSLVHKYRTIIAIQDYQKKYLKSKNIKDLRPMTLKTVADLTGLSEAVICQLKKVVEINGIPIKNLFSNSIGEISTKVVQALLKDVIDNEDKNKPYSDSQLQSEMKSRHNINLSRRTITKYRINLQISSTTERKIK